MSNSNQNQGSEQHLIVLILRDQDLLEEVLSAWESAGASGSTVLDCIGRTQLREALNMDDVPMFPNLSDIMRSESVGQKLIFTIVSGELRVRQIIESSREILQNGNSHKGLLFTLPVGIAFGLGRTLTP
ncbi:MAG TPA: hypothetical protein VH186_19300 [Chloroflexia bacterium]|nr:hypothetical protein [Chloroflexia bacterium]